MVILTRIATALVIIGGINWGLIGLFQFNLVEELLGSGTLATQIVYIAVGVSALLALLNFVPQRR
jgi:uncharacterized membrane protein YuzA (DUF378 family)